ncbi:MAG TPA: arylsulfatase [Verrucomicrobiota bacterium]|nr:arylsulfatase [Verrucomicrobiota bacterium]HQB15097.1 arylsulfatase [Verrucomicrobiota bacterium]
MKRWLLVLLFSGGMLTLSAATKPNILLILADDIGFSDLGCCGGEIQTPNLDALARNGLRFTQFYNTSRCCPTRASLLTGLYPHQAGVGHMMVDRGHEGYRSNLNRNCVTLAEVMRSAGYRTYMCGKWHVTNRDTVDADNSNWPVQRGFEKFYGTIRGYGNFYDPASLCRQNTFITPVNDPEYRPETFYYTEAITDNAVRFLRQHHEESPDQPFFFYLAYTAAHWPMQALPKDIAKYRGKYDDGYAPIHAARLRRLRELGLLTDAWQPAPLVSDWDAVKRKKWEARCMEVYAAMIDNMDQGIGRVLAELKRIGQFDNTVILYLNDNGACAETMGRKPLPEPPADELKPMPPDMLQDRIRLPMQTRDGRPVRSGGGVMPGPADSYIAYGLAWANVSNTPFREYKHWVHEGGISTPLIVHWPQGIAPRRRGQLESQPGHLVDIMATCVDLSGAKYPTEFRGHPIKPMEGISLLPAIQGRPLNRKNPLFWEHESNRAIRDGKWKLVAKENQPWELYDMEKDRTEMHNLAASQPERVSAMAAQWEAWAARANVLPLGSWREKPAN